jgi:nuclear autoantigenic sperm protein
MVKQWEKVMKSDLDVAWKMLDIARAIVEKQSVYTMEQVDILSTLADVALEKGIFTLLCLF